MAGQEMSAQEQEYWELRSIQDRRAVIAMLEEIDVLGGLSTDDKDTLTQMIIDADSASNWRQLDAVSAGWSAKLRRIHATNVRRLGHRLRNARKALAELEKAAIAFAKEIETAQAKAFGQRVSDQASRAGGLLRFTITPPRQPRGRKAAAMAHRCELFEFLGQCGVSITERYIRIALIERKFLGNVVAVRRKPKGVGQAKHADAIRAYVKRHCERPNR